MQLRLTEKKIADFYRCTTKVLQQIIQPFYSQNNKTHYLFSLLGYYFNFLLNLVYVKGIYVFQVIYTQFS